MDREIERSIAALRPFEWLGAPGRVVSLALESEKRAIRQEEIRVQRRDARYGLVDDAAYHATYGGRDVECVCARSIQSGERLGHLRLRKRMRLDDFPNLGALAEIPARQVLDVGGHIGYSNGPRRELHDALFAFTVRLAVAGGIRLFYSQCRPEQLHRFEPIGFVGRSEEFEVRGWEGRWCAMALDLDEFASAIGGCVDGGSVVESALPKRVERARWSLVARAFDPSTWRRREASAGEPSAA